jgi:hypothetical protein
MNRNIIKENEPKLTPDEGTIKKFKSNGVTYELGLSGNLLLWRKINGDQWFESTTTMKTENIIKLKQKFYNLNPGDSIYSKKKVKHNNKKQKNIKVDDEISTADPEVETQQTTTTTTISRFKPYDAEITIDSLNEYKMKIIKEQKVINQNDYNKLKKIKELNCLPEWVLNPNPGVYDGKDVIEVTNSKNQKVYFFADMTAYNPTTDKRAPFKCEALSTIENETNEKSNLIKRFQLPLQNTENILKRITPRIGDLIKNGFKSKWFGDWNRLLQLHKIRFTDSKQTDISAEELETSMELPLTADERSNYQIKNWFKDVYDLDNQLQVFEPKVTQKMTGIDQSTCSNIVTNYLVAALRNKAFGVNIPNLNQEKPKVQQCLRGKEMDNFTIKTSELEERVGAGRRNNSLRGVFSGVGDTMSNREIRRILNGNKKGVINTTYLIPENKTISKIIKESLNNLSVNKRKEILVENKIVRNRFRFLIEGKKTLTKKQTNILFENIINEMVRLSLSGIDKKVINEELVQLLGTMFQSKNGEVMEMFKEKFGNWIADKVVDVDSEILSKSSVKDAINSVDINSVVKLIDCDYLSDLLTRLSVRNWSETLMRVSNPSTVSDTLRKTLKDTVDNTNFHNELKNRIKSNLCPVLSDIQNKMNDAENKIKSKVLST